jgi:aryl-alcohol dehydrogenase-like predicted oxidoreductase
MQYFTLGRTGMKVSRLCFGTMSFGGDADEQTSAAMFNRCREAGINFFDCADIYQKGRAEEILGALAAGCRDKLVLTSKVYAPMSDDPNDRGLSRRHIMLAVENSLRRLRTDRLDLYFCHALDPAAAMEETLQAMDDLVRQGKILCPAVSNWSAWQIERALGISARLRLARFECIQPMYSLVKRQAEVEILPMAAAESLGVIPYSPLGGGLLTGKYGVGRKPETGRIIQNDNYRRRYAEAGYYETTDRFVEHAKARGVHPATLAVAWVMHHPAVTAPIIGARNLEQLGASLAAADLEMTAQWRAEISALSPEPPPATDRSEEKTKPMW